MIYNNIVAFIGAREGSKRLVNKNLRLLANKPLIVHSIITGLYTQPIDRVIVSTDSIEIAQIARECEAEVSIRPKSLATDTSTDLDWISYTLEEFKTNNGYYPKTIVFLRPTTPLRTPYTVERIVSSFNDQNSSLRTVEQIPEAIEKMFRIENEVLIPACNVSLEDTNNPNQVFPITYKANGYCDILKSETILNSNSLYGNKIQSYITPKTIEIDEPRDLELANLQLKGENYIE
jgi:CMP-N-acetylneuraminic acid synthetase